MSELPVCRAGLSRADYSIGPGIPKEKFSYAIVDSLIASVKQVAHSLPRSFVPNETLAPGEFCTAGSFVSSP